MVTHSNDSAVTCLPAINSAVTVLLIKYIITKNSSGQEHSSLKSYHHSYVQKSNYENFRKTNDVIEAEVREKQKFLFLIFDSDNQYLSHDQA